MAQRRETKGMTTIICRNGDGDIIKEVKSRVGQGRKLITATKGDKMKRKFGTSPFKNWSRLFAMEFGRVR